MSADDGRAVTVTTDELTVEKRLDTEDFQTLAIVFELRSERSAPARVQVVDEIPESIPMDDVGFHPEYGGEDWSIQGRTVVFERTLTPDSDAVVTIYGVRGIDAEEAEAILMDEPTLELVEQPSESETVSEADRSNAVREFLAGETDSLPGLDTDAVGRPESTGDATEPDESIEEPEEAAEAAPPEPSETTAQSDASSEPSVPVSGGVARVLANELRDGKAAPEDRQTIQEALAETPGSTEARLDHLQSRVGELDAYTAALEAFLDEQGTADLVDDIIDRLDELDDQLDATADAVSEVTDRLDETEERLDTMAADHERFESATDRLDPLEEDIQDLQDELDDLATFRERLSSVFGAAGGPPAEAEDDAAED